MFLYQYFFLLPSKSAFIEKLNPIIYLETLGILLLRVATVKIWNYLFNKEFGLLKEAMKLN